MPGFRFGADLRVPGRLLRGVRDRDHDDVGSGHGRAGVEHPETGLRGERAALRGRREADDDVDAGLAQVQRMGMALAAEPDDRDGLAGQRRQVRVRVVVHLRRHRLVASSIDCAPRDITTAPVRTISLIP